ncbi:helix-turn-helix domain-containing protein [Priestia megaterium]|uniref:helix-turn-helix domain-containing protein n=1 Tax=Priestia megaterium TaxID=1404 RepID=UPI00196AFEF8|nr:helix-turn-helix domain-containing protein [Priestia megaterium]QSF36960.1 helix-turn-helix domain-containing protein [Priestia megaterium]
MTIYDKKKKYEGMTFYKRPKDTRYYLYLPRVNAGTLMIYDIICDFYNSELGYSFPSQDRLALESGMGRDTVGNHIKKLFDCGLIVIQKEKRSRLYNKYRYVPQMPLNKEELFRKYPKAHKKYEEAKMKVDDRYAEIETITNSNDLRF